MDQLERVRSHRRAVVAGCGIVAVAASAAAVADVKAATPARSAALTPQAFTVTVGAPEVTAIDLGRPGKTPGDLYAIRAPVFDGSGAEIGRLAASQTSIRLEHRAETVQVSGTFELRDGTIVIGGLSLYPLEGAGNLPGRSFVRPVLGGTGRYAGVGGTVTTVRGADGRYAQRFSLTAAAGPTEAVRLHATSNTGTRIDLGATGASPGDLQVFSNRLVDDARTPIGRIVGELVSVDTGGQPETIIGPATYDLPDGQIAIDGVARSPQGASTLVAGTPVPRAVTGGTGAYAGRAGTVTTVRGPDGGFESTLYLLPRPALTRKLRVIAGRGSFDAVDLSPAGPSAADLTVFGAPVRSLRGRRIGRARGTQTTVERRGGALVVQARITYDLRHGDIVVGGLSLYPAAGNRPIRGRRFVRPVLGGTGRYAGARGTLTTIRRHDGSFRQVFRLTG